jgi:hypothetical protein
MTGFVARLVGYNIKRFPVRHFLQKFRSQLVQTSFDHEGRSLITFFTIENIRGLLYSFPSFLEVVGVDPTRELDELGFIKTEPSAMDLLLYQQ